MHQDDAPRRSIRNPITFSATPARYTLPPPELDEHGDDIKRWLAAPQEETR